MASGNKPLVSPSGQGEQYWIAGDIITIKAKGKETGGSHAVVEFPVSPGNGVLPHTHTREDETFYILEGELNFTIGERTIQAKAGTFLYAPRDIPHAYSNPNTAAARVLVSLIPAGFEGYFVEVGEPVTEPSGHPPAFDLQKYLEAAPRYGLKFHLPDE